MTDPKELTEPDLLLLWRALSTKDRERFTAAIIDAIRSPRHTAAIVDEVDLPQASPKKRGPRPTAHAKARWIKKRYDLFAKKQGKGPVKVLWPRFVKTLPKELRDLLPKATARSRDSGGQTDKAAANTLSRAGNLDRQRRDLKRLVFAMKATERASLAARGSSREWRDAIVAGRAGRREDLAEITRLADVHEQALVHVRSAFYRDSAARALLGDEAVDAQSFIRIPPRK